MAYKATIPVGDHSDPGACTNFYEVMVKLDGASDWTQVLPYTNTNPIVITGLLAGNTYNLKVRRFSCSGEYSPEATTDIVIP